MIATYNTNTHIHSAGVIFRAAVIQPKQSCLCSFKSLTISETNDARSDAYGKQCA